jgi:hypothetical protein
LLSIFLSRAMAVARARLLRADRGARTSARRSTRTLEDLAPVRGVKTVLPKLGDDGVTGTAACDGNDGALAALPMPLGSDAVGLLAGPAGMPEIDELPAPAEPAGGVSCAHDDTGESITSNSATSTTRIIEVFSKEAQPIYGAAGSAKKGWCRKRDSNPRPRHYE